MAIQGTPLHKGYCLSYMRRGKAAAPAAVKPGGEEGEAATAAATAAAAAAAATDPATAAANLVVHPYENSIKVITTVTTVEGFWETYDFLKRPNDLPTTTDYHFFREGIMPTWEDPSNAKGGKWIVRLPKGLASRYWEEIILALIGAQFTGVPDGEICGAVLSVRYNEDIIGIWTRTATDREVVDKVRDGIKKILQLPAHANMEYKAHQNSLQDKSSFRNTQVWKPKSLDGRNDNNRSDNTRSDNRSDNRSSAQTESTARRQGSWGEREAKPKSRDTGRWR